MISLIANLFKRKPAKKPMRPAVKQQQSAPVRAIPVQAPITESAQVVTLKQAMSERSERVIKDVIDIPSYLSITTVIGGKHELNEFAQEDIAALEVSSGQYVILVTKSSYRSNQHAGLINKIIRSGGEVVRDYEIEPGTIRVLYKNYLQKISAEKSKEVFSAENPELRAKVERMVSAATAKRASDIHICVRFDNQDSTGAVLFRIDGTLRQWDKFPSEDLDFLIAYMYTKMAEESSRSEPSYNNKEMQSCTVPVFVDGLSVRIRYQTVKVNGGFDAVLRLLILNKEDKDLSPKMLGYSDVQCHQLDLASRKTVGVIIIAGVTGSGKSTTLKTLITMSPRRNQIKTYSIEDPVEYKIYKVSQINVQRSSSDTSDISPYLQAMRVVMRADPDVIMAGEIRDYHSCEMLQTMVQSGHQVLTTVHATSAFEIPDRITSTTMGLSRHTLSSRNFISALVYQKLVPNLCPHCKVPAKDVIPQDRIDLLEKKFGLSINTIFAAKEHENECEHCEGYGTKGMTVVAEIVQPDITFLRLIREGKDLEAEELWRGTRKTGFDDPDTTGKTAFEHGLYKVSQGLVDPRHLEDRFDPMESYRIVEVEVATQNQQKRVGISH